MGLSDIAGIGYENVCLLTSHEGSVIIKISDVKVGLTVFK